MRITFAVERVVLEVRVLLLVYARFSLNEETGLERIARAIESYEATSSL